MQLRANGPCAIVHVFETHSVTVGCSLGKPAAVVRNAKNDFSRFPAERDDNRACLPMSNGIVNGFLRDPVKMHGCLVIRHEDPPMAFEPARNGEERSDGKGQPVQRRHQARRAQVYRVESARDLARLNSGRP